RERVARPGRGRPAEPARVLPPFPPARLAAWSERLRQANLVAHVQWDTYFPETARFGGPEVMELAEEVFAADSAAVLAQLQTVTLQGGPDLRTITAAGMLDLAIGWLGDTGAAMRWLIVNTRPVAPAPARTLYDQAVTLANPYHRGDVTSLPNGENIAACWAQRRAQLAGYRHVLRDAAELLPDLLHLNHARVAGTDPGHEALCLHLARAAALSWSAHARRSV
ncbi:thiopeptide-type bacteriocin biosynthesis protein, partial [Streptosporangium sp. NPDC001682]